MVDAGVSAKLADAVVKLGYDTEELFCGVFVIRKPLSCGWGSCGASWRLQSWLPCQRMNGVHTHWLPGFVFSGRVVRSSR